MGKIRIKHLGLEELEEQEKNRRRRQREQKKIRKEKKAKVPGLKGGERLVEMTAEEEVERLAKIAEEEEKIKQELQQQEVKKETKKRPKKTRSASYRKAIAKINPDKKYPIKQAVKLLKEISYSRFNGAIEAHINTIKVGIRGFINFPHGIGKERKIAIADEQLIKDVAQGSIDFDILVASPQMMPKLAKVAKILGPRNLMPNPKTGTIADDPHKLAQELKKGKTEYKTEAKFPIIHQIIGRIDFDDDKLIDNFNSLISAIGPNNISSVTLAATMSPGIKIALENQNKQL